MQPTLTELLSLNLFRKEDTSIQQQEMKRRLSTSWLANFTITEKSIHRMHAWKAGPYIQHLSIIWWSIWRVAAGAYRVWSLRRGRACRGAVWVAGHVVRTCTWQFLQVQPLEELYDRMAANDTGSGLVDGPPVAVQPASRPWHHHKHQHRRQQRQNDDFLAIAILPIINSAAI